MSLGEEFQLYSSVTYSLQVLYFIFKLALSIGYITL